MNPSRDLQTRTTVSAQPRSIRSPGSTPLPSAEELAAVGQREVARLAADRRRAAQAELERAVGRSGIPRRFLARTFDSYLAATSEQRQALDDCRTYADGFAQVRRRGGCLLLLGAPRTGKTHLACAILAQVIQAGHTGLFLSVSAALRIVRDAYSLRGQRSETEAFALLIGADLLVLDEVEVAIGHASTRRAMLFDVLNDRYGEMRPTILIGNLTAAELEAYLGERILDRLRELGSVTVPFAWPSHRRCG
jgi:DNA replication protein DnaC